VTVLLPPEIARLVGDQPLQPVTVGESDARVWRVADRWYLKAGFAADVADEATRLEWFTGRAPVPRVIAHEHDGQTAYLLTEAIDGVAAHCVTTDRLACVQAVAAGLRLLHALDVRSCPFDARRAVRVAQARAKAVAGRVDEADFDATRVGRTALALLAELEAMPPADEDLVVTHGDFCLPNVVLNAGSVAGFVDVGRAGVADRHQDLALAARSIAYNFGDAFVAPFFDAYGIVPDPGRLAFYTLLDVFF